MFEALASRFSPFPKEPFLSFQFNRSSSSDHWTPDHSVRCLRLSSHVNPPSPCSLPQLFFSPQLLMTEKVFFLVEMAGKAELL